VESGNICEKMSYGSGFRGAAVFQARLTHDGDVCDHAAISLAGAGRSLQGFMPMVTYCFPHVTKPTNPLSNSVVVWPPSVAMI